MPFNFFHLGLGFCIFFTFWLISCSTPQKKSPINGNIHHVVICWLKDPGNLEHRNKLVEGSQILSEIPGVLSMKAGSVLPSHRNIADSSFDVAIMVSFPNPEAMNSYLSHPHHKKLVKELVQPLTQKVLVYDFID
ncbi:MAG TPA: Dabb family protein [Nitrospiria bacterium]|jgi:hypothetical protein